MIHGNRQSGKSRKFGTSRKPGKRNQHPSSVVSIAYGDDTYRSMVIGLYCLERTRIETLIDTSVVFVASYRSRVDDPADL